MMEDDKNEVSLYFVKPHLNEENGPRLVKAYEELQKKAYNFKSEWVTADDCLKVDGKGKQLYIFDTFEGPAFEHVKNLGYRIFGPLCILGNLLHGFELPKRKKRPIFNLAMKGVKVCCTSIDKPIRDEITKKVYLMGGDVDTNLMMDVTHLIAGEVGSSKYLVGLENKKIVMTKEWVDAVWNASQEKHISALDESFDKYLCPPFLGLTVCVSGFSSTERNKMRNFIVRGGGKYSGELKKDDCTHLVVKEPKGAKYDAAKNWEIRIVKDQWLYESMDKQKYMDPKPYQYNVAQKTSTPENKSVSGPSINDISAISHGGNTTMQQINETRNMTTRISNAFTIGGRNEISETMLGMSSVGADESKSSSVDIVLEGCKIYLSGVKPATEEKLRKIMKTCGALKSSAIDSTLSHVIVGETVPSDIQALSKLKKCPHVVTADWLLDCFSSNVHHSEAKYERSDLGLITPSMRKEKEEKDTNAFVKPKAASPIEDTTAKTNKDSFVKDNNLDSQDFKMDAPSDLEMADLLSQYSMPGDETAPKESNAEEVSENQQSQDETIKACNAAEEEGGMTQDPEDVNQQDPEVDGIFSGKSFVISGFPEEDTEELASFITERGGKVVDCNKKNKRVDITIVPLTEYSVDCESSEVLTNAWLQMCIEADQYLPYDTCSFARPIKLPDEAVLENCCISVSGFVGVERDVVTHLCQSMGAKCQEHFVRRSNKHVDGSTHLLVNFPSGSKYVAAKKWGIPAVGIEWIYACIESGHRVPEADFHIDVLEQKRLQSLAEKEATAVEEVIDADTSTASKGSLPTPTSTKSHDQPARNDSNNITPKINTFGKTTDESTTPASAKILSKRTVENQNTPSSINEKHHEQNHTPKENVSNRNKPTKIGASIDLVKEFNDGKDVSIAPLQQRRDKETAVGIDTKLDQVEERIPTSSAESAESVPKVAAEQINPMSEIQRHLSSSSNTGTPSSVCRPNQSENISAGKLKTPIDAIRQKWAGTSRVPSTSPASGPTTPAGVTPSTFLQPGYKPKWDIQGFLDTSKDSVDLNQSTPLGEVFRRHITLAAQKLNDIEAEEIVPSQSPVGELPPLHGVVIAVAKKLGRSHETYNQMVVELGGDYSWHSGAQVTHFVFQGRPNDVNKEFRKAREEGKIIVSPHWLIACKEQYAWVEESLFPHNFNPSCSLTLTPARRAITPRSTRAAARGSDNQTLNPGKTPKKPPVFNMQNVDQNKTPDRVDEQRQTTNSPSKDGTLENVSTNQNKEDSTTSTHITATVTKETPEVSADRSKNQEMKEALSNALGNVLADASRSKRSTRRKGKLMNLSGQMSTPDGSLLENNVSGAASWSMKSKDSKPAPAPEPSQSLQVTWDDPTERLEKEKLAHRLEAVCEPSQSTDEMLAAVDVPNYLKNNTSFKTTSRFNDRSPTPEPPPIAFPISRPSHVPPPQPVELLSDESSDSRPTNAQKTPPVFLISGMTNEERIDYSALVEQLGGRMVEIQHFDPASTHLVVGQPARNEKFLSCIASGKWVLHKSFFEASRKEGKFVHEEHHEWGSEYTIPLAQTMTEQASKLAAAAHKWRRKVASLKKENPSCQGAFHGWKVLLRMPKNKEDNFRRLLQAGGATVTSLKSQFPDEIEGTHAFLDLNKVPVQQEDLEKLIRADIHCLKAEYIPAYLTDEPPPHPSDFYPPEVQAIKACMPEVSHSRKRHSARDDASSDNSKRTRRR